MNRQHLLITLLLTASAWIATPAQAADVMTFPGSICHASDPSQAGKILRSVAGVQNTSSTTAVMVNCPLVRDNHSNFNGTDLVRVYAYRSSSAGATSLQCTLSSRNSDGGSVASNTASYSGIGSTFLTMDVDASTFGGYYVVSCYLPPASSIRGIYLDEVL
ncbi:hypothetical protein [Methylocucumis oryzae]|uniref:Spore coat protein U domain-containing protein n=1 Tax=Methylocucumis oryzae TaxID=1632867 RepID=A0A0F3IDZ3_9GAMM|nr:hypothetical protein [Methylocucumis oryzae]KJV05025.1 hypothetical protein VZ94_21125 [Methylocucumis oryzae]